MCCKKAGTKRDSDPQALGLLAAATRAVLLLLLLVVQVVEGRLRCVHRIGVSRMPLTKG